MMNRSAFLAAILSAVVLTGCASSGTKLSDQQVAQMKVGQTTWGDMVASLGSPTAVTRNSDGTQVAVYSYIHSAARPETFIPIIGPFVGGADAKGEQVVLMFGADGKLAKMTSTNTAVSTGLGGTTQTSTVQQ